MPSPQQSMGSLEVPADCKGPGSRQTKFPSTLLGRQRAGEREPHGVAPVLGLHRAPKIDIYREHLAKVAEWQTRQLEVLVG